jgi:hypothetical protein
VTETPGACAHGRPADAICPQCLLETLRAFALPASQPSADNPAPTPLAAGAIQQHEYLMSLTGAGFTRVEAMQFVLLVTGLGILRSPLPPG